MAYTPPRVTPRVFRAVQRVDVASLPPDEAELRPVLASLVRMSLIASLDRSRRCNADRTTVLEVLSRIELVNNLVALLSIDFHALEIDVRKEQQLRAKVGSSATDSVLIKNLPHGPALDFERSDATRRLRLVLSELLVLMAHVQNQGPKEDGGQTSNASSGAVTFRPSELFDHLVYFSEVSDVLCIAMAELPMILSPPEVCEALLRLKYGAYFICHVVANQPDTFKDVIFHLLKNGDKQDDDGNNQIRQNAVFHLCQMNPSEMANVRTRCIDLCRMPSLALQLTIELHKRNDGVESDDLVSFMSGLLLGSDPQIRSWISFFVRSGQKKRNEHLVEYRKCLVNRLTEFISSLNESNRILSQRKVVLAAALLRLYTALRGIAGMKFSDEEIQLIFELISCQPPPTPAGVKFVSLGLCILIACSSIISVPSLEKKTVEWIRWLVKEENYFEQKSGVSACFGEMLLLMAIHFHSNQLTSIGELVCQTLGMKIALRSKDMNKMKIIFTHEIFSEQVVASHAIRVPVTSNLSAETSGFLPVHCIHQLLKSRAFSKHKVPVKNWIYKQICAASTPLHPVLPSLIEVYVNSILVPVSNRGAALDQTNEPISEAEIRAIFEITNPFQECSLVSSKIKSEHGLELKTENHSSHGLSAQILMLYYVMLYENVRLNHMKAILVSQRSVLKYSQELFADLPIKFLIQMAEREQDKFGGVFPQLLKLCSSQFPHLCMVKDWLDDDMAPPKAKPSTETSVPITITMLKDAFESLILCPPKLTLVMQKILNHPAQDAWYFAEDFIANIGIVLDDGIPRQVREYYKKIWFHLNTVYPRKLWVKTVSALIKGNHVSKAKISQDDLMLDPLQVLRCDKKVFRCAPILEIVLYILKASLAASKTHLIQHALETPILERTPQSQVSNDMEREELRNALVATQESAAIQILLEAAAPNLVPTSDKNEDENSDESHSMLTDLKEIQSLICSYLHEAFIADPNLAKLVHFQGYPLELLPITVSGVPSMHICLDFIPELLSQPDLDKQIFAVDLISHLSIQYALPKSYSIARLAVNALSTLLSVLSVDERNVLFPPVLPSLVRISRAFPPLTEDVTTLLQRYGKICVSESSLKCYASPKNFDMTPGHREFFAEALNRKLRRKPAADGNNDEVDVDENNGSSTLVEKVEATFAAIVQNVLLEKNVF